MRYIYKLINPIDQVVFYVGCSKNPKSRYNQHIKNAKEHQNTPKNQLIYYLLQKKILPRIEIIEKHPDAEYAREREEYWVKEHINTILNIHMPGKGSKDVKFYKEELGL